MYVCTSMFVVMYTALCIHICMYVTYACECIYIYIQMFVDLHIYTCVCMEPHTMLHFGSLGDTPVLGV